MSADGGADRADPWLNLEDQKSRADKDSLVMAKYGSVGKILAQNTDILEKTPPKKGQTTNPSAARLSGKSSKEPEKD